MSARPPWIRPVLSLLVVIGVGAFVLAGGAWLAVKVLPDGDAGGEDGSSGVADAPAAVELVETGLADPDDVVVEIDRCELVDGVIEATGVVQNLSDQNQAFVLHLAVLVDGRLFDGTLTEIDIPTVAVGQVAAWGEHIGAVDPDAPPVAPPVCEIERIALAGEIPG